MFKVYPTAKIIVEELDKDNLDWLKSHELPSNIDCGCGTTHVVFKHGENGDIGDFTFIHCRKLQLGEGVHIAPRVTIVGTGSVTIGDYSTIAPGVVIYTSTPDLRFGTNKYAEKFVLKEGDVEIGRNVFIGCGVVIPYGTFIPDNTVIGAGVTLSSKALEFLRKSTKQVSWIFQKQGTDGISMTIREMGWKPK